MELTGIVSFKYEYKFEPYNMVDVFMIKIDSYVSYFPINMPYRN